jgi:hypothetical protein
MAVAVASRAPSELQGPRPPDAGVGMYASLDALFDKQNKDVDTYDQAAVEAMLKIIRGMRRCGLGKLELDKCADVVALKEFLNEFGTERLHLYLLALGFHQPEVRA